MSICLVLNCTDFNQGPLCDYGFGGICWRLVDSVVDTQIITMIIRLPETTHSQQFNVKIWGCCESSHSHLHDRLLTNVVCTNKVNCSCCGFTIAMTVLSLEENILQPFTLSPGSWTLLLLLQWSLRCREDDVNVLFTVKTTTIISSQHLRQPWFMAFTAIQYKNGLLWLGLRVAFVFGYKHTYIEGCRMIFQFS